MEDPLLRSHKSRGAPRASSTTPPLRRHRGSQWGGWAVAASFYLFDVFLRLTVNVVTSKLQKEFDLSAAEVSAAFSSSFFYAYAAGQIPVGFALDFLGPRATIVGASLLSCVGCVLFSFAESAAVGTAARIISGVGCGCGWLGAVKVTRNSFGTDENSDLVRGVFAVTCMLGVSRACEVYVRVSLSLSLSLSLALARLVPCLIALPPPAQGLGGLVSQAPFQALTSSVGWRSAFRISAVIPVAIAVCAAVLVGDVAFDDGGEEEETEDEKQGEEDASDEDYSWRSPSWRETMYKTTTSPLMWMLALYLGGTDAPFETFDGLWGYPFLTQALSFSPAQASRVTTLVVIVATACQLLAGPLMGYCRSEGSKILTLCGLALLGVAVFLSFVFVPYFPVLGGAGVVYSAAAGLGVTVGSCTITWSLISSSPICDGSRATGLVSGAVNTLVIGFDAATQQAVGAVLSAKWNGTLDAAGERTYSQEAYSSAFVVLTSCFAMSAVCAVVAWARGGAGREGRGGGK